MKNFVTRKLNHIGVFLNRIKKKKKKATRKSNKLQRTRNYMSKLPLHLVEFIFCKVSVENLVNCRYVYKTWRNLILDPCFAKLRLSADLVGSYKIKFPTNINGFEFHACYHDGIITSYIYKKNLICGDWFNILRIVGSFNGVLCLCEPKFANFMYLFNPITSECVTFPRPKTNESIDWVCGFGFSSNANQYKVIRIVKQVKRNFSSGKVISSKWEAEIFTVDVGSGTGTGTWRSIGHVPYDDIKIWIRYGTFLNGVLHWLSCLDDKICTFDIGTEQFLTIGTPSLPIMDVDIDERYSWSSLGVFENCLYICSSNVYDDVDVEIWVMKEYGVEKSWTKEFVIKSPMMDWWSANFRFQLIKKFENGEILMLCACYLVLYNPKEGSFKEIDVEIKQCEVISYVPLPSFSSPMSMLMGNSLKMSNVETI